MPLFDFKCKECEHVWEDILFSGDSEPTQCPKCDKQDCISKLLSLPGPGKVLLTGQEYKKKIFDDAKKLKQDAKSNENLMANLVGETKYQSNEVVRDKVKSEIKKS